MTRRTADSAATRGSTRSPAPSPQPDAAELIRRATARPGIREVMRVYEDWKRIDRGIEPYRTAAAWPRFTNSDRANPSAGE